MISPIRSTNFLNVKTITPHERSKRCSNLYSTPCDSVSFSGKLNRLSDESIGLVQNFAKKLQLNKVYKFDNPNVERFQMTSIASPKNPETRTLVLQYSGYSKDNMTKHIMCTINDLGEIFESGIPVKKQDEITIYEKILPELINHASKELKANI